MMWQVWRHVSVALLLLGLASQLSLADDGGGSGEPDLKSGKKLSLKLMFGVVFGTVVITAVVVVAVLTFVYKIRWRQRRDSPLYLGSCRNINSAQRTVNIGMQALDRAPTQHHYYHQQHLQHHYYQHQQLNHHHHQQQQLNHHHHQAASSQQPPNTPPPTAKRHHHHQQQEVDSKQQPQSTVPSTAMRWQDYTPHQLSPRRDDPDSRMEDPTGRGRVDSGESRISSLSHTYTYPHLVAERYTNWEQNVSHIEEVSSERSLTTSSSTPSLTAPYLVPIRTNGEAVRPQAEHPIYMGLDPHTMEENDSKPYEKLNRVRQGERTGLKGSAVATVAGARRKPPPRLKNKTTSTNHNDCS